MNSLNPFASYRARKKRHRIFERLAYPVGFFSLLASIPQIYDVWIRGNVDGLSAITWAGWVLGNLFWIGYGIVDDDRPILFLYIGWLIVNGSVLLGIIVKS